MDDRDWLAAAIEEAWRCPPSERAFSVGAIVVAGGTELARGHSRETDDHVHAEEAALAKLPEPPPGATIYSSLEPCGARASRPRTCTELILAAGIRRVVFAWREPSIFVDGHGAERLAAAGVTVVEVPELAEAARQPNRHLLDEQS
jgi:diaminohydroxyphosphoribosylaminopyrimidine deaminase / 5-amino-6-(5-phosphoribosylamino)uracil reductase